MPVITLAASVMRKQVNFHPHNSIYGPCGLRRKGSSFICIPNLKWILTFLRKL